MTKEEKKRVAHRKVTMAILKGFLKREPCCMCGHELVDAHHESYDKPLEIIWLCRKHHRALHMAQKRAVVAAKQTAARAKSAASYKCEMRPVEAPK